MKNILPLWKQEWKCIVAMWLLMFFFCSAFLRTARCVLYYNTTLARETLTLSRCIPLVAAFRLLHCRTGLGEFTSPPVPIHEPTLRGLDARQSFRALNNDQGASLDAVLH